MVESISESHSKNEFCLEINEEENEMENFNGPEMQKELLTKKFFVRNTLLLFLYTLIFAVIGVIEIFKNDWLKEFLYELDYGEGGVYVVIALVIIIMCLSKFVKFFKRRSTILIVIWFIILTYNSIGMVREMAGLFQLQNYYIFFASIFLPIGLANFITSFTYKMEKGFDIKLSSYIFLASSIVTCALIFLFYERKSDRMLIYLMWILIGLGINFYIALDFKLMSTVREGQYINIELNGFIHWFIDMFYFFWYDMARLSKFKNITSENWNQNDLKV